MLRRCSGAGFPDPAPRFPETCSPALGKPSLAGDLRDGLAGDLRDVLAGDPEPARRPGVSSTRLAQSPRPGTGFHCRPGESHGHKLMFKRHRGFHLQKESQPRGWSWGGSARAADAVPVPLPPRNGHALFQQSARPCRGAATLPCTAQTPTPRQRTSRSQHATERQHRVKATPHPHPCPSFWP